MFVDLKNFVGVLMNNEVACRRATVAGDDDAVFVFESQNGGRVCRL